jgi:O-antigen/teichoic acid export membrane protein
MSPATTRAASAGPLGRLLGRSAPAGSGSVMLSDGLRLTLSAGLTSGVGLVAWVVAARLLTPAQVGRAAAFVSGFMLVASLGDLGLDRALMRWVPQAGEYRRRLVLRCYAAVLAGSLVAALALLALPAGATIRAAAPAMGGWLFAGASMSWAVFQFQDPVLVSLGRARWVLWENVSISVARVTILAIAGPLIGTAAVLLSWIAPGAAGVLVVSLLVRRVLTSEQAPAIPGGGRLPGHREVIGLLAPVYPARVCSAIVVSLVPLLVTGRFGAAAGAVFYVAWMAGSTVDYAAVSFTQSVIVRIAHEPERAWPLLNLAVRRAGALFIPVLVLGAVLARPLLAVFGSGYADHGTALLRLILLGCIPRLLTTFVVAAHVARGHGWTAGALEAAGATSVVCIALTVPAGALTAIGAWFAVAQLAVAAATAGTLVRFDRAGAAR